MCRDVFSFSFTEFLPPVTIVTDAEALSSYAQVNSGNFSDFSVFLSLCSIRSSISLSLPLLGKARLFLLGGHHSDVALMGQDLWSL